MRYIIIQGSGYDDLQTKVDTYLVANPTWMPLGNPVAVSVSLFYQAVYLPQK